MSWIDDDPELRELFRPASEESIEIFVSIMIADQELQKVFQKHGRLRRRDRKRTESAVQNRLHKQEPFRYYKVRIYVDRDGRAHLRASDRKSPRENYLSGGLSPLSK